MSTHLETPVHKIRHCVLADDGIERVSHLKVSGGGGGTHYFRYKNAQIQRLPTQLIIVLDFWAKILRIAHPVNYSYLPPCSGRHSNSNFAHHFVIHWLLQNGANKNQHQDSYQRETIYDKFIFSQNWCFSLLTKKCEKEVKIALFYKTSTILTFQKWK